MAITLYEDMTPTDANELENAWVTICQGLEVYGRLTGAGSLTDYIYEQLWDEINQQKSKEELV